MMFSYDTEGYEKAKKYLKEIGEWDRISSTGFSVDGWSIIQAANIIWERNNTDKS